jgi:hypothetical protein
MTKSTKVSGLALACTLFLAAGPAAADWMDDSGIWHQSPPRKEIVGRDAAPAVKPVKAIQQASFTIKSIVSPKPARKRCAPGMALQGGHCVLLPIEW